MAQRPSRKETGKDKKDQRLRIKVKRAARRSGQITEKEGKVEAARSKKQLKISQKRMATVKKSRH